MKCVKCGNKNRIKKLIILVCISITILLSILIVILLLNKDSKKSVDTKPSKTDVSAEEEPVLGDKIYGLWVEVDDEDCFLEIQENGKLYIKDGGVITPEGTLDKTNATEKTYLIISNTEIHSVSDKAISVFRYQENILIYYEGVSEEDIHEVTRFEKIVLEEDKTNEEAPNNNSSISSETKEETQLNINSGQEQPSNISYLVEWLSEAIAALDGYMNYGAACFWESDFVYEEAWEYLNEEQSSWVFNLMPYGCCYSIQGAKEHLSKYLAPNMYSDFNSDSFLEYRGILYGVYGDAAGKLGHYDVCVDEEKINRTAYNKISVTTTRIYTDGSDSCQTQIDFEYQNGAYKIVSATNIPGTERNGY